MRLMGLFSIFVMPTLFACESDLIGLKETPIGDGPMVIIDWEAEPLPEIPFPNDLALRPDRQSPTGYRINISTEAPIEWESETRTKLNQLTGFGIFSPITVSFDKSLDLSKIVNSHRDDPKLGVEQFQDDLFFLIDIDPNSDTYQEPIPLEIGQGRYPCDVPTSDRFFPNDSRKDSPSVIFDTVDEDVNGNGVLDWGEDTDNDGVLDIPNVYPLDSTNTRDDLLCWYERNTNTLLMRPVYPLNESSQYAVVLTDKLSDTNGNSIRSPWKYVHHLKQTESLQHVEGAMEKLDLSIDDIAFAWTYSTGRVTMDLVDIQRGLVNGEGPFSNMSDHFPAVITKSAPMKETEDEYEYAVGLNQLISILDSVGFFDDGSDIIPDSYTRYTGDIVGGAFMTPNLLVDKDDGGENQSDEWWDLNPVTGDMTVGLEEVNFNCIFPNENVNVAPPYDVVIYGHGYGSSRSESLLFGWAFTQIGYAYCFMDFPGHGINVNAEEAETVETIMTEIGLSPLFDHLLQGRATDLTNNGSTNSGGDQWTADVFHTRDMVRQAVVDWMQFVRILRNCGTGQMPMGDNRVASCDWNNDGTPDLGGPDSKIYILGGSLGGINSAVAAAVIPDVEAFAPIAGGGGLFDMALRTEIGGAVEAMHGRLMSPLFLGEPQEDGQLKIVQMVNSERKMRTLPIGHLDTIPPNGKIIIENLANGESVEGLIPPSGHFRLGIAADAMDPHEKAVAAGIPKEGPVEDEVYFVEDNVGLGDPLVVSIYTAEGERVKIFDEWEMDVVHEGITMFAGSPLIAGSYGTGRIRNSSNLRRIASVFGAALEPGDPIAYAPHYFMKPFESLGGKPANVLLMPTAGDTIVPIGSGIAIARAAGMIDGVNIDDRYGMTQDQFLVDRRVIQGLEQYGPYTDINGDPCLFDADDFDNGLDGTGAPSDAPLRLTINTSSGQSGLRIPYVSTRGSHGFREPDTSRSFDQNSFSALMLPRYFQLAGQEINMDACLADFSCDWIPDLDVNEQSSEDDQ